MSETAAQKRERILRSENDHAESFLGLMAAAVPGAVLVAAEIEEPFTVLLAHPSKWSQPRGTTPTSVVIHCNGTGFPAVNTASFFHSSSEGGSAQAVADDIQGFTCVPDDAICAGAPPLNQEGLHIEQPGRTDWSRETWLSHDKQLRRVAFHVAGWCKKYDIPVRLYDENDLRREGEKARCITYHDAVSKAFHDSNHGDPMPNFPFDVLMGYVQTYFDGGDDMALTPQQQDYLVGMIRFNRQDGPPPDDAPDPTKKGFTDAKERWDKAMENPPAGAGGFVAHTHQTDAGAPKKPA